ncbi:MAG: ABC transporter permease, partial [Lactobacillus iners]|nr:ABC transporter permease [Lactobacillus iners]
MTIMKKYLPIFYLGIKSSLVYRGNYLIKIITQVLNLIVTLWMWCWLMGNNVHNFNYLAKYLIMTNTLSLLFSIAPTFTLADLIQSGKLSNYLTKPVSLYWYLYLTYIGSQLPLIIFYLV